MAFPAIAAFGAAAQAAISSGAAKGGMDTLRDTLKVLSQTSDGSLVGATQSARVEPTTLIDADILNADVTPHLLQTLTSIFAGYYLRAFAMTSTVGDISVASRLDPLSTHRNPLNSFMVSLENYEERLPFADNSNVIDLPEDAVRIIEEQARQAVALESKGLDKVVVSKNGTSISKDAGITDVSNMAVGKIVNVTIENNSNKATIPIAIRLSCISMTSMALTHIMTSGGKDVSFGERWAMYRHNGISLRDLVFAQDLIDEHKKNMLEDKSGVYLAMMQKRTDNNLASIISGGKNVSINNSSNIVILSEETLAEITSRLGIDFTNFNARQKVFEGGYYMLIAVVSKRWGRVRIYTRGIKEHTDVSNAQLVSSAKGTGPDIGDILSAFRAGSSPNL